MSESAVYFPESLGELMQLRRRHPDATIYAGGTGLLAQRAARFVSLPDVIITLQEVDELQRVSRTERHLEFGAAVPLRQLINLGPSNVPVALHQAISHVGPPAVAGLATAGGNLATPGRIMTLVPVLTLLDARVELRRPGRTRWLPAGRVHRADGSLDFMEGAVITRIRVPLAPWTRQVFRRFGSELAPDSDPLTFCGVVRSSNRILEEVRLVGSAGLPRMIRNKSMEAELVGRRLPLSSRDVRGALELLGEPDDALSPIQRARMRRLVKWFLLGLR
jgi:CO/xanthine dehydrogenase FAD-binding subunit